MTDQPTWHNDGHTLTVVLEADTMSLEWGCPFRDTDLSNTSWDDRPHCRQSYGEYGHPQRDDPPLAYCNVGEFITAANDPMECAGFDVPQRPATGTFRVEYRWSPGEECYLWRPLLPEVAS